MIELKSSLRYSHHIIKSILMFASTKTMQALTLKRNMGWNVLIAMIINRTYLLQDLQN